jgi:hypothetical protein
MSLWELCPVRNFLQMHLQELELFWLMSAVFLKRNILSNQNSYMLYIWESIQAYGVPRKDHFMRLRSVAKSTFKCLILDTPLWRDVIRTNLKNSKEQDDRKKGALSNQPRLTRITPSVLLGNWEYQPLKDMTSLRTDFKMHAYWQVYAEEPGMKELVAR